MVEGDCESRAAGLPVARIGVGGPTMRILKATITTATLAFACTTPVVPPRDPGGVARSCPLGVAGAQVSVEDTQDGIAMTFLSQENAFVLRERVRDAAAMHGPGGRRGYGHRGEHGDGGEHGLQPVQLPPARAAVTEIDGGARLSLVPSDAADVERLRAKVRERAKAMQTSCR